MIILTFCHIYLSLSLSIYIHTHKNHAKILPFFLPTHLKVGCKHFTPKYISQEKRTFSYVTVITLSYLKKSIISLYDPQVQIFPSERVKKTQKPTSKCS